MSVLLLLGVETLGPQHSDVAISYSKLANVLRDQSDLHESSKGVS